MEILLIIGLFIPLVTFLLIMFSSSYINRTLTGFLGCGSVLASFICFAILLAYYTQEQLTPQSYTLWQWIPIDQIHAGFSLRLDPLSLVMGLIVTGVGFLIHFYSNGYMEHDEDFARYFACMNFFIFSMLLLVLSDDILLLFVGWEGVGLASYLLIGYYYKRPSAAQAATKAFVVNRIGDFGFLLGLLLAFVLFATSNITEIASKAPEQFSIGSTAITLLTFLLFIGAVGKSAQIPLQVWLPDAMEGPTPVSALIHAATMVTAGVYLVVRLHDLYILAPLTLHTIGAVGGVTSLYAAFCAIGQMDLKKVLAYSTISQLGLMFLACGVGAFYAAMFHLTTHAFMKALLFLSAGNVIHMMQGTTDMKKMGGLRKNFPLTHWLFLVGVLAMSGIPPLAAFFSKDLILEQEYLAGFDVLFYIALATSILTAFYLTRAYCLTFLGKPNLDQKILATIHEAPKIMTIPTALLALLSLGGGFLGFTFGKTPLLEGFLAEIGVTLAIEEPGGFMLTPETIFSIIGGMAGLLLAYYLYTHFRERLQSPPPILQKGFYFDFCYDLLIVKSLWALSNVIANQVEPNVIEGFVHKSVQGSNRVSKWLQKMQSGQIRSYAAWLAVGMIAILVYFIL